MSAPNPKKNNFSELQKSAEEKLNSNKKKSRKASPLEVNFELDVHKLELEIQNEELRETQLKLVNTIENFTELFDYAPIGYFILDENGVILNVNINGTELMGLGKKQLVGKRLTVFINGESCQDDYYRHHNRVLETKKQQHFESEIKKKNGLITSVFIETNYIRTKKEGFKYLLTIIKDISERKNAENVLAKNQRLLQSLFDNTATLIIIKDLEGRYLMVNKQFEKIHNTTNDKLIGKTVYDILPLELADKITANDRNTIEQSRWVEREELVIHKADGSIHTYLSGKFPLFDKNNKVYSICNVATDITEKKKHEEEILETKARLEAIIENGISSIWSVDRHYKLTESNSLYKATFQKRNAVTVYAGMPVLDHLNSEEQNLWKELYDRALNGEHFSLELKEHVGFEEYYFDFSFNPIWIHNKVEGVSVFARDITDRKILANQLTYKVNELNTFMYRATHDLRSPLTSLLGLIKIAKETEDQSELRNCFGMIDTSVKRMDKLLIDLVSIVRVTQGEVMLSVINFESIMDEILESLSNHPNFSRIIFKKIIKSDKVLFQSDRQMVYSVLQNIIDNSIKYSKNSPLVNSIIIIDISVVKSFAKIKITDNGIGIPKEFKDNVFDMFYRATTVSTGTGLGLYIVKNTVEKLNGEISLESEENAGSNFFITLPSMKQQSKELQKDEHR